MNTILKSIRSAVLLVLAGYGLSAHAVSIDWAGTYRFEYIDINSTSLASAVNKKAYALNSLLLSPKIIAVDGVNVVSQFQLLSNSSYPGAATGQAWGLGHRGAVDGNANTTSNSQGASSIEVRQLYLNLNQEYGAFVVGRSPMHFGLGMTYNAGNGAFDHWSSTHDIVGYKFLVGNLSMMPMIGKVYDSNIAQGDDITDTMIHLEYNNPETESLFGLIYSERKGGQNVNDVWRSFADSAGAGATAGQIISGYSVKNYNLIVGRGWESFKIKFEAGFRDGTSGFKPTGSTDEAKVSGFGVAMEMEFPRPQSKWDWKVKMGLASGDNPNTKDYEGFSFHRNYDVAFLMFNHPMGQYDTFRSGYQRNRAAGATPSVYPNEQSLDEESISNAMFLAPSVKYSFGEKWTWTNSFTYAVLQTNPALSPNDNIAKDIGFEWDTGILYKPHERVQWINEVGVFMPGGAFRGGTLNYDTNLNFGFQSKAAISF